MKGRHKTYCKKHSQKNYASWDPRHLKQFSNVLPWFCLFCTLAYFIVGNSAKCISLDLVCLHVCLFFLEDWRLGKIEYFIVIRGKVIIRAGQDIVFVFHFYWSHVRGTYLCRRVFLAIANDKTNSISKRWTIKWILINCFAFISRQAFERWQSFAVIQREDEGFESLAIGPIFNGLCKTRKQSVSIRIVPWS